MEMDRNAVIRHALVLAGLCILATSAAGCIVVTPQQPIVITQAPPGGGGQPQEQPQATQPPAQQAAPTEPPPPPVIVEPEPMPRMFNFHACRNECNADGSNAEGTFAEATTKVYLRWNFENIPEGAAYVREWDWEGQSWVRYECSWPGPSSGVDEITLTDPYGLRSGTWTVTISIDGQVLLREQIQFQGNHQFWAPIGTLHQCYGKVPARPPIPQECGKTEATADYGPVAVGSMVILGRHREVNGDDNWNDAMGAYVGKRAKVTLLSGVDAQGCPGVQVDIDGGTWFWRLRDLTLP